MSKRLEKMLGDLVAQAQLDAENELLDQSDDTRKIWDAIVERYGKVDNDELPLLRIVRDYDKAAGYGE